jgi:hypothetical protein
MAIGRGKLPSQTAALAGIPAGIQAVGPWAGRRQLFVKFAGEAETATMYTAEALKSELKRLAARSRYHSIAIAGRDPLAESEYIAAVFDGGAPLPVMLDHDGQRPDVLQAIISVLAMVQIGMDGCENDAALERACTSLIASAGKQVKHAIVIIPAEQASDARLLQIVEQVHAASAETAIVLHPTMQSASAQDRRWILWLERAAGMHEDVRLLAQLPGPTGMR